MISLSKKIFYAIEAVLYIAHNAASGPISGRDIAKRQNLSPRYLEQLMQRLVRAGILRGIRGPHGGYVLARERRRISVADICQALGGDDDLEIFKNSEGMKLGGLVVMPVLERAQQATMECLKKISLAELCEDALCKNIKTSCEENADFAI